MTVTAYSHPMGIALADEITDIDLAVLQGMWSVEQYLALTAQTNRLLEYTDGVIEVLPMPTDKHQSISLFLLLCFLAFVRPRGGVAFYAPLRLEIRPGKFREPDLLILTCEATIRDGRMTTGAVRIWCWKSSVPTIRRATWRKNRATTPKLAFLSTGSSTRWMKR
jgi:hypothetical protein